MTQRRSPNFGSAGPLLRFTALWTAQIFLFTSLASAAPLPADRQLLLDSSRKLAVKSRFDSGISLEWDVITRPEAMGHISEHNKYLQDAGLSQELLIEDPDAFYSLLMVLAAAESGQLTALPHLAEQEESARGALMLRVSSQFVRIKTIPYFGDIAGQVGDWLGEWGGAAELQHRAAEHIDGLGESLFVRMSEILFHAQQQRVGDEVLTLLEILVDSLGHMPQPSDQYRLEGWRLEDLQRLLLAQGVEALWELAREGRLREWVFLMDFWEGEREGRTVRHYGRPFVALYPEDTDRNAHYQERIRAAHGGSLSVGQHRGWQRHTLLDNLLGGGAPAGYDQNRLKWIEGFDTTDPLRAFAVRFLERAYAVNNPPRGVSRILIDPARFVPGRDRFFAFDADGSGRVHATQELKTWLAQLPTEINNILEDWQDWFRKMGMKAPSDEVFENLRAELMRLILGLGAVDANWHDNHASAAKIVRDLIDEGYAPEEIQRHLGIKDARTVQAWAAGHHQPSGIYTYRIHELDYFIQHQKDPGWWNRRALELRDMGVTDTAKLVKLVYGTVYRRLGPRDPQVFVKMDGDARSLPMLANVLSGIDQAIQGIPDAGDRPLARLGWSIAGGFVGNRFDMGDKQTRDSPLDANMLARDFVGLREQVHNGRDSSFLTQGSEEPNEWYVDHTDQIDAQLRIMQEYTGKEYQDRGEESIVAVNIDNAGPDSLLGALPLIMNMALSEEEGGYGLRVVVGANENPRANDETWYEFQENLERAADELSKQGDSRLRNLISTGRISVMSTGGDNYRLDLANTSGEWNALFKPDRSSVPLKRRRFLINIGQGRGPETLYENHPDRGVIHAPVNVPVANLFTLKLPLVAEGFEAIPGIRKDRIRRGLVPDRPPRRYDGFAFFQPAATPEEILERALAHLPSEQRRLLAFEPEFDGLVQFLWEAAELRANNGVGSGLELTWRQDQQAVHQILSNKGFAAVLGLDYDFMSKPLFAKVAAASQTGPALGFDARTVANPVAMSFMCGECLRDMLGDVDWPGSRDQMVADARMILEKASEEEEAERPLVPAIRELLSEVLIAAQGMPDPQGQPVWVDRTYLQRTLILSAVQEIGLLARKGRLSDFAELMELWEQESFWEDWDTVDQSRWAGAQFGSLSVRKSLRALHTEDLEAGVQADELVADAKKDSPAYADWVMGQMNGLEPGAHQHSVVETLLGVGPGTTLLDRFDTRQLLVKSPERSQRSRGRAADALLLSYTLNNPHTISLLAEESPFQTGLGHFAAAENVFQTWMPHIPGTIRAYLEEYRTFCLGMGLPEPSTDEIGEMEKALLIDLFGVENLEDLQIAQGQSMGEHDVSQIVERLQQIFPEAQPARGEAAKRIAVQAGETQETVLSWIDGKSFPEQGSAQALHQLLWWLEKDASWWVNTREILAERDIHTEPDLVKYLRGKLFRWTGIRDTQRWLKEEANERALAMLQQVKERTLLEGFKTQNPSDAFYREELLRRALAGVFMGNRFDASDPHAKGGDLLDTLCKQWFKDYDQLLDKGHFNVDHTPAFFEYFESMRDEGRPVVICVDNAGPDTILGVLPLVALLRRPVSKGGFGLEVIIGANENPRANDITWYELQEVLQQVEEIDPEFADLEVISTGMDSYYMDYRRVSPRFAELIKQGAFPLHIGQGRGTESMLTTLGKDGEAGMEEVGFDYGVIFTLKMAEVGLLLESLIDAERYSTAVMLKRTDGSLNGRARVAKTGTAGRRKNTMPGVSKVGQSREIQEADCLNHATFLDCMRRLEGMKRPLHLAEGNAIDPLEFFALTQADRTLLDERLLHLPPLKEWSSGLRVKLGKALGLANNEARQDPHQWAQALKIPVSKEEEEAALWDKVNAHLQQILIDVAVVPELENELQHDASLGPKVQELYEELRATESQVAALIRAGPAKRKLARLILPAVIPDWEETLFDELSDLADEIELLLFNRNPEIRDAWLGLPGESQRLRPAERALVMAFVWLNFPEFRPARVDGRAGVPAPWTGVMAGEIASSGDFKECFGASAPVVAQFLNRLQTEKNTRSEVPVSEILAEWRPYSQVNRILLPAAELDEEYQVNEALDIFMMEISDPEFERTLQAWINAADKELFVPESVVVNAEQVMDSPLISPKYAFLIFLAAIALVSTNSALACILVPLLGYFGIDVLTRWLHRDRVLVDSGFSILLTERALQLQEILRVLGEMRHSKTNPDDAGDSYLDLELAFVEELKRQAAFLEGLLERGRVPGDVRSVFEAAANYTVAVVELQLADLATDTGERIAKITDLQLRLRKLKEERTVSSLQGFRELTSRAYLELMRCLEALEEELEGLREQAEEARVARIQSEEVAARVVLLESLQGAISRLPIDAMQQLQMQIALSDALQTTLEKPARVQGRPNCAVHALRECAWPALQEFWWARLQADGSDDVRDPKGVSALHLINSMMSSGRVVQALEQTDDFVHGARLDEALRGVTPVAVQVLLNWIVWAMRAAGAPAQEGPEYVIVEVPETQLGNALQVLMHGSNGVAYPSMALLGSGERGHWVAVDPARELPLFDPAKEEWISLKEVESLIEEYPNQGEPALLVMPQVMVSRLEEALPKAEGEVPSVKVLQGKELKQLAERRGGVMLPDEDSDYLSPYEVLNILFDAYVRLGSGESLDDVRPQLLKAEIELPSTTSEANINWREFVGEQIGLGVWAIDEIDEGKYLNRFLILAALTCQAQSRRFEHMGRTIRSRLATRASDRTAPGGIPRWTRPKSEKAMLLEAAEWYLLSMAFAFGTDTKTRLDELRRMQLGNDTVWQVSHSSSKPVEFLQAVFSGSVCLSEDRLGFYPIRYFLELLEDTMSTQTIPQEDAAFVQDLSLWREMRNISLKLFSVEPAKASGILVAALNWAEQSMRAGDQPGLAPDSPVLGIFAPNTWMPRHLPDGSIRDELNKRKRFLESIYAHGPSLRSALQPLIDQYGDLIEAEDTGNREAIVEQRQKIIEALSAGVRDALQVFQDLIQAADPGLDPADWARYFGNDPDFLDLAAEVVSIEILAEDSKEVKQLLGAWLRLLEESNIPQWTQLWNGIIGKVLQEQKEVVEGSYFWMNTSYLNALHHLRTCLQILGDIQAWQQDNPQQWNQRQGESAVQRLALLKLDYETEEQLIEERGALGRNLLAQTVLREPGGQSPIDVFSQDLVHMDENRLSWVGKWQVVLGLVIEAGAFGTAGSLVKELMDIDPGLAQAVVQEEFGVQNAEAFVREMNAMVAVVQLLEGSYPGRSREWGQAPELISEAARNSDSKVSAATMISRLVRVAGLLPEFKDTGYGSPRDLMEKYFQRARRTRWIQQLPRSGAVLALLSDPRLPADEQMRIPGDSEEIIVEWRLARPLLDATPRLTSRAGAQSMPLRGNNPYRAEDDSLWVGGPGASGWADGVRVDPEQIRRQAEIQLKVRNLAREKSAGVPVQGALERVRDTTVELVFDSGTAAPRTQVGKKHEVIPLKLPGRDSPVQLLVDQEWLRVVEEGHSPGAFIQRLSQELENDIRTGRIDSSQLPGILILTELVGSRHLFEDDRTNSFVGISKAVRGLDTSVRLDKAVSGVLEEFWHEANPNPENIRFAEGELLEQHVERLSRTRGGLAAVLKALDKSGILSPDSPLLHRMEIQQALDKRDGKEAFFEVVDALAPFVRNGQAGLETWRAELLLRVMIQAEAYQAILIFVSRIFRKYQAAAANQLTQAVSGRDWEDLLADVGGRIGAPISNGAGIEGQNPDVNGWFYAVRHRSLEIEYGLDGAAEQASGSHAMAIGSPGWQHAQDVLSGLEYGQAVHLEGSLNNIHACVVQMAAWVVNQDGLTDTQAQAQVRTLLGRIRISLDSVLNDSPESVLASVLLRREGSLEDLTALEVFPLTVGKIKNNQRAVYTAAFPWMESRLLEAHGLAVRDIEAVREVAPSERVISDLVRSSPERFVVGVLPQEAGGEMAVVSYVLTDMLRERPLSWDEGLLGVNTDGQRSSIWNVQGDTAQGQRSDALKRIVESLKNFKSPILLTCSWVTSVPGQGRGTETLHAALESSRAMYPGLDVVLWPESRASGMQEFHRGFETRGEDSRFQREFGVSWSPVMFYPFMVRPGPDLLPLNEDPEYETATAFFRWLKQKDSPERSSQLLQTALDYAGDEEASEYPVELVVEYYRFLKEHPQQKYQPLSPTLGWHNHNARTYNNGFVLPVPLPEHRAGKRPALHLAHELIADEETFGSNTVTVYVSPDTTSGQLRDRLHQILNPNRTAPQSAALPSIHAFTADEDAHLFQELAASL
ncbi:MAG: DUF89 family protein [Candidatus Omnitrophica bacterium]|nr:DUF89 family protein [Candidatus Omnitrophota bacterium]